MEQEHDGTTIILRSESDNENVKIEYASQTSEILEQNHSDIERAEQGLSGLADQVLNDANDIFGTSETGMEVDKSQNEHQQLEESVIELSSTSENVNLNEGNDNSRDSLEDKLSQMEG